MTGPTARDELRAKAFVDEAQRLWQRAYAEGFAAARSEAPGDATEPAGPLDVERLSAAIKKHADHMYSGDSNHHCVQQIANDYAASPGAPREDERLREALDDGSDPWGDVWDALDRLVPGYPEDDDDMGEIRRIVSQRQDARRAALYSEPSQ
jgi:hypothetical protein